MYHVIYSNVDQCPLPVIVSGVSAIPLTLYDRAPCSALRLATQSYAIRFSNRIRLPSEVVCDRKSTCEERSD